MQRQLTNNPATYYVYVRPGYIEYFNDLEEAEIFARDYDTIVKEC